MSSTKDLLLVYEKSLNDLTTNAKPQIDALSITAKNNPHAAAMISEAIFERLRKKLRQDGPSVAAENLPVLYLIDSIFKNVGKPYTEFFAVGVVGPFCDTYMRADEAVRRSLIKLKNTWPKFLSEASWIEMNRRIAEADEGTQGRVRGMSLGQPAVLPPRDPRGPQGFFPSQPPQRGTFPRRPIDPRDPRAQVADPRDRDPRGRRPAGPSMKPPPGGAWAEHTPRHDFEGTPLWEETMLLVELLSDRSALPSTSPIGWSPGPSPTTDRGDHGGTLFALHEPRPLSAIATSIPPMHPQPSASTMGFQGCVADAPKGSVPHPFTKIGNDELRRRRDRAVLEELYPTHCYQCPNCGLRMSSEETVTEAHQQWHFEVNRRKSRRQGTISRSWLPTRVEFEKGQQRHEVAEETKPDFGAAVDEDVEMADVQGNGRDDDVCVEAAEAPELCAVCQDGIEQQYSQKRQMWLYMTKAGAPTAARLPNGTLVHVDCLAADDRDRWLQSLRPRS
eukprot:Rmarinus@m.15405